jgi:Tol biopolymer transport system component
MPLTAGMKLGQYEIRALLGVGGMGEVYRAFDPKLKRDVAVKILPANFAEDPERVARFRREAQLLAALNHPNIAVIHDVQEDAGTLFLVLELVEGESLAERLMHGPLALDEALETCKQIAEALEAAHGKGILHRDLKPGNVQITREGRVKVLDFGLAKMTAPEPSPPSGANSPTVLSPVLSPVHTRAEIILGTAAYMSPEQARSRSVDARADLWAFGCVLFETLTARRAFEGEDVTETIALIVKGEPDWSLLPAETPAVIRSLLRQCLQKQPKQRLGDARSARLALEDAIAQPALAAGAAGAVRVAAPRMAWWPAAAAAAGTAAMAALFVWALWPAPAREPERLVTRLLLDVAPAAQLAGGLPPSPALAISPDGRTIVFAGDLTEGGSQGQNLRIYRRRLDETVATPLPGTEGGFAPFFAPDGEWIAFLSWPDAQLKKVPAEGGPAVTIARIGPASGILAGASWGPDNAITYAFGVADGISRVSADGSTPERVTSVDTRTEWRHTTPHVLPDGRTMLYTVGVADGDTLGTRVMAYRFDTREAQLLLDNAADARFLASGHLLYMRRGTLMAAPFDAERVAFTGAEIAMLDGVVQAVGATNAGSETYHGQFQVAANGTLVYLSGGPFPPVLSELVWLDRDGTEEVIPNTPPGWGIHLRLAPDGTRLAMAVYRGEFFAQNDIWVYDLARSTARRLTYGGANPSVVWSPDGGELVYHKQFSGHLFRSRADGSGGTGARVTTRDRDGAPATWSQTDNALLFFDRPVGPGSRILALPMDAGSEATPFKESRFNLGYLQFSPNGRWLAYASNETGTSEVYVEPYPGPGGATRVSTDGGHSPAWAANELFYLRQTGERVHMMAVDVDATEGFRAGAPRVLFELPVSVRQATLTGPLRSYDVAADGRRFVMSKLTSTLPDPITQIHVVLNWTEELKRRVPVGSAP